MRKLSLTQFIILKVVLIVESILFVYENSVTTTILRRASWTTRLNCHYFRPNHRLEPHRPPLLQYSMHTSISPPLPPVSPSLAP
jgi:hypothetical protein